MIIELLKKSLSTSIKTTWWLLKIMIPVTLAVSICSYLGWIEKFSVLATPLFSLIGLEGKAAIPFITSIFTNLYAAIAVMASLSLDYRTVTILATMCLIAHNMIVECKIQQKAGSPIFFIAPLRIGMALISGFLLNKILPEGFTGTLLMPESESGYTSMLELIKSWAFSSVMMTIRIIAVVFALNVIQNTLKAFNLIEKMKCPLAPLMAVLGLPTSTSILWIIANTLGLAYGGIAIVDELEKGEVSLPDVRLMNSSIALTHSLLEDSLVFMSVGIGLIWIIVPRTLLSIITVIIHKKLRKTASAKLKFL